MSRAHRSIGRSGEDAPARRARAGRSWPSVKRELDAEVATAIVDERTCAASRRAEEAGCALSSAIASIGQGAKARRRRRHARTVRWAGPALRSRPRRSRGGRVPDPPASGPTRVPARDGGAGSAASAGTEADCRSPPRPTVTRLGFRRMAIGLRPAAPPVPRPVSHPIARPRLRAGLPTSGASPDATAPHARCPSHAVATSASDAVLFSPFLFLAIPPFLPQIENASDGRRQE